MERRDERKPLAATGFVTAVLLVASPALSACTVLASVPTSHSDGVEGRTTPPALSAKWRGTMTVTPGSVATGERVALRFASTKVRGIAFSLSSWGRDGWTVIVGDYQKMATKK